MKTNPNDYAYPQEEHKHWDDHAVHEVKQGLTKRELFAAMAMQGLMSNLKDIREDGFEDVDIELFAVMRADALIGELNRRDKETQIYA